VRAQLDRAVKESSDFFNATAASAMTVHLFQCEIGIAADDRQQIVEIVCDAPGETPDRLQSLRLKALPL